VRTKSAELTAAPFFVVRTPLLPFDEWIALGDGLTAPSADDVAAALARDRAEARVRLRALVARPEVREALFVASPSLDEALEIWTQAPTSERGLKAERSLVRYIARMCGRPTPFGLFAGCTVGRVDASSPTRLELAPRAQYRRHTRLDMDYLFALCETLAREPELRERLRYRPNSSLYRAAGRVRYVEARLDGKERSYHLVAVDATEYVDAVLTAASDGATLAHLQGVVAERAEVDVEEARAFVDEMVAAQLLVPDLEAPVTGPEPIHAVLRRLEGHAAAGPLEEAHAALGAIDQEPLGVAAARYRAIADGLAALPVAPELSRLFQVDLVTAGRELALGGAVLDEIAGAVDLLHRMTAPGEGLRRFREAFAERYEGAEVPLAEVLDEEAGIGFQRSEAPSADASPLIEGLPFGASGGAGQASFGAREQLLLDKVLEAAQKRAREIQLEPADLERLAAAERSPLPASFAAMVTLVAPSVEACAEGRFDLHLHGTTGPSGANLLGRFCHGDAKLDELVRAELREEERSRPDALFAEVVHLPEGRIGNVLLRPVLREWELPFLGASGAPPERQLPLSDLTIRVEGARVVLRSRRLGREIIPRLTSAHNYSHPRSLRLYRFLCVLQSQGVAGGLGWSWGALDSAAFLPRVRCGRVVLSAARWRLDKSQLAPLAKGSDDDRWRHVQALRRTLDLPRFVALEDGDNRLPIDLDHVLAVESFAHLVKERERAILTEAVSGLDELPVQGPEGRFVHELIVPFRRPPTTEAVTAAASVSTPALDRRLVPGGDCLYVKLYTGAAGVDELLRSVVAELVRAARASGAVRDWFFIRYGDPDWHLRLRFFGDSGRLREEVLPAIGHAASALVPDGRLWRMQLDTYHREVERYGGPVGLSICEQVFGADSDAVLAIVEQLEGDAGADARWRLALLGTDRLLDDLGFDLDEKHRLMTGLRRSFALEFKVEAAFEKQLGARFRRERTSLEALLAPALDAEHPLAPGGAIFAERSARQRPLAAELRAGVATGRISLSMSDLAASLVHMHINRILRASARANELVIYDFLKRLYEGQRARAPRNA
jgi:thiopeptide-type bacteriocin biosynthesis protein